MIPLTIFDSDFRIPYDINKMKMEINGNEVARIIDIARRNKLVLVMDFSKEKENKE